MPQVPGAGYEPYVGVEAPERVLRVGEAQVIPEAYGSRVAAAARQAGLDADKFGEDIMNTALNWRQKQVEMGVRDDVNDWYNNTASPANDKFLSTQGAGANSDAAHAHLMDIDAGRRAARDAVQRKYGVLGATQFDSDTAAIMRSLGREATLHSISETNKANEASYKNSSDVSNNLVFNSPNDNRIYEGQKSKAIKDEESYAINADGTPKFDADVLEQNKKDAVNKLALNRVIGLSRADVNGTGAAFDVLRQLERNGDLSNRADIENAEKIVRTRYDAASTAAIASKEEKLLDEVRATGDANTPRAQQIQRDIDTYRQRRVMLGDTQETADRNNEVFQQKVKAAAFEYRVNGELRGSSPFQGMIDKSAAAHGLNPVLLARQLHQESGLNPNVPDSRAGAQGIAQFIPETARQSCVNVRDPASSIEGAARYMEDLTRQFGGNTGFALAAYNAGPERIQNWLDGRGSPLKKETLDYVKNITGISINDWRAGERPDIASLPAPPGAAGSIQRAAALVDQARTDPSVPPSQRDLNAAAGEKVIQKYAEDNIRLANTGAVKQKQVDDKFFADVIDDSAKEQPRWTETMIKQLPDETQGGPSAAVKLAAIRFLNQEGMPGPTDRESHINAEGLFKRMLLPDSDPQKISDIRAVADSLGTTINWGDFNQLKRQLDDLRSPGGERLTTLRKQLHDAASQYIDHFTPLAGGDPDGKLRVMEFERLVDGRIAQYRADKKEPWELFDPDSPAYLGKRQILDGFAATLEQSIQSRVRGLESSGTKHMPNESPGAYINRVTAQ